jgi:tetrachlorobenzoquinone reductase
MTQSSIEAIVSSITDEAEGTRSYELRRADGGAMPDFTAGAHIDLHLESGLIRSYSLCSAQSEVDRYVVAISKDPASRSGSRFIHETIKQGDKLTISEPRNHFPLVENASHMVFIAGAFRSPWSVCWEPRGEQRQNALGWRQIAVSWEEFDV